MNVLHDFENDNIHAVHQNLDEGCYYTRRYPEDSRINWQAMTDVQIHWDMFAMSTFSLFGTILSVLTPKLKKHWLQIGSGAILVSGSGDTVSAFTTSSTRTVCSPLTILGCSVVCIATLRFF